MFFVFRLLGSVVSFKDFFFIDLVRNVIEVFWFVVVGYLDDCFFVFVRC